MAGRKPELSPLDQRISSGLRVVATGPIAEVLTASLVIERRLVIGTVCGCGKRAFVSAYRLRESGRGDVPLGELRALMVCRGENGCGARSPDVSLLDPAAYNAP